MESWNTGFNCQNDKEKKVMLDEQEKALLILEFKKFTDFPRGTMYDKSGVIKL